MAPKRAKRGWLAFTVLFIATRATDSVRHHARFTTALPKGSGPTPNPKATRLYRTAPVSYVPTISRNNAYYCFSVAECTLLCSVSGRAGLDQHKGAVIGVPSIISSSEHYPSTFPVSLKSRRPFFFTANGVKFVKRHQRLSRLSKTFLPATLALVSRFIKSERVLKFIEQHSWQWFWKLRREKLWGNFILHLIVQLQRRKSLYSSSSRSDG